VISWLDSHRLTPPKQKLLVLQKVVGYLKELSYMIYIGDQNIAQGIPPLSYESLHSVVSISHFRHCLESGNAIFVKKLIIF
jgi:hypothetical protein